MGTTWFFATTRSARYAAVNVRHNEHSYRCNKSGRGVPEREAPYAATKNKHDAHTELCVIARVTPMRLRNGTTQQTIKSTYTCPEALYQRPTDRTRTQSPSVALPAWLPLQHFARPLSQQPRSCSLTEVGGPNAYAKRAIWRRCGGRLRRTCQAKRSATCVSRDAPSSLLPESPRVKRSVDSIVCFRSDSETDWRVLTATRQHGSLGLLDTVSTTHWCHGCRA